MDDETSISGPTVAPPAGRRETPAVATVPARPTRRAGRTRRRVRTGRSNRIAVWCVAVVAALAAGADPGQATGLAVVDALWAAGLAASVVLAASRARRWSWIVTSAVLVAVADGWWLGLASAAVVLAVAAVRLPRRRAIGAVVGLACSLVALHLPPLGGFGGSSVVAGLALAPLLISGYRSSPAGVRSGVRWVAAGVAALVTTGAVALFVALMLAWGDIRDAESSARAGLTAAERGDAARAAELLEGSSGSFAGAAGSLDAWWVRPVRVIPVLGQHGDALAVAVRHGRVVTDAAAESAATIDLDELRASGGLVDVADLHAAAPVLRRAADEVAAAESALRAVRSPWLAGPLDQQVAGLAEELADVAPDAELGALAAEELPAMLGAEGKRRYLLAFTTPAESRGVGGFVGSWAVLEADGGHLELTEQGRAADVNEAPGRAERRVTEPPDYVARYGRFEPGAWFQDVTFSPDVPSSGSAAAQVFEQAGFGVVDGVVFVDPHGLAALLELTGPVVVEGRDEPLTADDAVDWLLRRQYVELGDDEVREDLLGEAAGATFEALLDTQLPGPRQLSEVLYPAADQGRLSAVAFDAGAQELLARLGADRPFPRPTGGDLAGLVTQNSANNKIDVFLHRRVTYDVSVDPSIGRLEARVHVELENRAPAEGLPDAVLGSNDRGLPPGTNRMYASWYSPLNLREARVDGAAVPVDRQRELGWWVYSTFLEIPPGGTRTFEMVLVGDIEPEGPYRLDLPVQPLVNPDEVTVTVRPAPGWTIVAPTGSEAGEDGAVVVRRTPTAGSSLELPVVRSASG